MSIWTLKNFAYLHFKISIIIKVKLFDLLWYKNVELILKFRSNNWISFLIWLIELILLKIIEFKKSIWYKNSNTQTFSYHLSAETFVWSGISS